MGNEKSASSLRDLESRLSTVARLLDEAARLIVELGFEPTKHLRVIGEALAGLSEIQHAIYREQPELTPQFLKDWAEQYRKDPEAEARDRQRTKQS